MGGTGRSPEQPAGPPHMHQHVPSGWHQLPRRGHTAGMCVPLGRQATAQARGPCCPAQVLSRGELGARRLLRKRKRRRSTCHSALRVLTWSHGPLLPGLYPRFGVSVRLSGKRIHSLHQVLSSKGPITRRNQAAHNNQPGLVRLGIEGQTE